MYDYRKMTVEERKAVLAARKARGYPLHEPPRGMLEAGDFHITAACYLHRMIFDTPDLLSWLQDEILDALTNAAEEVHAWCFLPNHYHVEARVRDGNAVSEALRITHSRIATRVNGVQGARGRQVFCQYTDRSMQSDRHYWTTVNYINFNGAKHGYVDDNDAWPWSSWALFVAKYGREWMENMRRLHPLYDYGKGWDW
ncbi:MAG: transposase [Armatimonadota bacterium]